VGAEPLLGGHNSVLLFPWPWKESGGGSAHLWEQCPVFQTLLWEEQVGRVEARWGP
jgi:hypothetical protein